MATAGAYHIWTADESGSILDYTKGGSPNPKDPRAVDIFFGVDPDQPAPPKEQVDLQTEIDKVLVAARKLFLADEPRREPQFRRYYVRLFQIAEIGLQGAEAATELGKAALAGLTQDLINDEAGRVKNGHLSRLGEVAMNFGAATLAGFVVLRLLPESLQQTLLKNLSLDCVAASNFLLLWTGCFLGVWLSYGIRTTTFTLADLTVTDSDRLLPHIRLLFAGSLTMLLALLLVLQVVEVQFGSTALSDVASKPMLAFVVGALLGISEASLPSSLAQRSKALVESVSK